MINVTTNVCNYYTNGIDICLLSRSISKIVSLSCRYLAIDDPQYKIYHLYYSAQYYVNSAGAVTFDSANPITSNFNVFAGLSSTGTLKVFALLNGFNATTDATYIFDITLTTSYQTTSVIRVVQSSGSAASFQLSSIQYCLIGYN